MFFTNFTYVSHLQNVQNDLVHVMSVHRGESIVFYFILKKYWRESIL